MRALRHPWGWTSAAPIACAVHCAAAPALAIFAPAAATGTAVEWTLLGATGVLAAVAIPMGRRAHGEPWPAYLVFLGLGTWTASLLHLFQPVPEDVTTTVAALATATGLLWNSRLHCGPTTSCSACEEASAEEPSVRAAPASAEEPASG